MATLNEVTSQYENIIITLDALGDYSSMFTLDILKN